LKCDTNIGALQACGGARELLGVPQTQEERFVLRAYLDDKYSDEAQLCDGLVGRWNASWREVTDCVRPATGDPA
jgi:hypothetical protein